MGNSRRCCTMCIAPTGSRPVSQRSGVWMHTMLGPTATPLNCRQTGMLHRQGGVEEAVPVRRNDMCSTSGAAVQ